LNNRIISIFRDKTLTGKFRSLGVSLLFRGLGRPDPLFRFIETMRTIRLQ
jgi:hypothetical protein